MKCLMCHRELKNKESMDRKMGKICYDKYLKLHNGKYRQLKLFYNKEENDSNDNV